MSARIPVPGERSTATTGRLETVPFDTALDAHRLQAEIYRRMGPAARLAAAFRLTDAVKRIAIAGIQGRHPEYTEEQVFRAWARLRLGDHLVRSVWPDDPLIDP
jgi:hypothetical protein